MNAEASTLDVFAVSLVATLIMIRLRLRWLVG